jgi:hypothetical protein
MPDQFKREDWLTVDAEGQKHVAGCCPRVSAPGQYFPVWDGTVDTCPIIPRAQWKTTEPARPLEWRDIDQNGYPACCLAATGNAIEFTLRRRGRALTPVDWLKAWRTLSGGFGGVAIDSALRYIMANGMPLADGSGTIHVLEAWDATTVDAFASGLQLGCFGIFGHDQHAEAGMGLIVEGGPYVDTRNTWGKTWGEAGWHKFPVDSIAIQTYGAFLIRELEFRPIDSPNFPDAAQGA